jgi:hypothetical protein
MEKVQKSRRKYVPYATFLSLEKYQYGDSVYVRLSSSKVFDV